MGSIVDILRGKKYFVCEQGATPAEIEHAQGTLGLTFAEDYRAYLEECGSASYEGHELTGISKDLNLDVVTVTANNIRSNPNVHMPLYVIEETHIDGIIIWQAPDKQIYQTGMGTKPVKIAENLAEYVNGV